jgi:hypothetical protein
MKKKAFWFSILGLLMVLALSGCFFDTNFEIHHHQDGSGKYRFEFVFPEEILDMEEYSSWEDAREDMLQEMEMDELYSADDPNIRSGSSEDFVNPETNAWHMITDIEVNDMLIPLEGFDEEGGFVIEANPDGTYRFSWSADASEDDLSDWFDEEEMALIDLATFKITLYVPDFIEGDARAVYNPNEKVVTWELPMSALILNQEGFDFWAIYKLEPAEVVQPDPVEEPVQPDPVDAEDPQPPGVEDPVAPPPVDDTDGMFAGLPNWAIFAVLALCCLTLMAIVVVVVFVFVISKRKKKEPTNLY